MELSQKLIEEIYQEIEKNNREESMKSVVHSDILVKYISNSTGTTPDGVKRAIRLMIDAHMILAIEIVAEDSARNIERIEGYVITDLSLITKLKGYFQNQLVKAYDMQFNKQLGPNQIIKEIFPIMKSLNNTEVGQVANKTIMLNEYERLLEKEYLRYTVDWQERKMLELASIDGFKYTAKHLGTNNDDAFIINENLNSQDHASSFKRAVDTPEYSDFNEKAQKYPLQRILNIYGIDFFLKIHLRKYEFAYIKKLIEDRQISKKQDLLVLKDMIAKIKMNGMRDKELNQHINDLHELERVALHAIYFTSSQKK